MRDAVRRLDAKYGFRLTDHEIDIVAKQAEEAALLFQPLFEVDLTGIVPLTKIDKKSKKSTAGRSKRR